MFFQDFYYSKLIGVVKDLFGTLLCLLLLWISLMTCTQSIYIQGRHFPELADIKGTGTLLFFFMENMELYQKQDDFFREEENTERLINRLKMNIQLLKEEYLHMQVVYVDIQENLHISIEHRVYEIPTIILFDRLGYEVRRWTPDDYHRGGGSMWEIKRAIEKLIRSYNLNS